MDWLEWAIRIAVVFGMSVFLVCAFLGAQSLVIAWRISLELWKAKRRYLAIQRQAAGFRDHIDKESE